jgi:hypothetical protein
MSTHFVNLMRHDANMGTHVGNRLGRDRNRTARDQIIMPASVSMPGFKEDGYQF